MTALHFRLSGEGFTDLVRAVFLEGDYARALRMIVNGLNGDGIEGIAQKVLDGTVRFSGNERDGFDVEDDDDVDYQKRVRWMYAGRVKLRGKKGWFSPRAVVVNCNWRDAEFARERGELRGQYVGSATERMMNDRASYYAEEGEVGTVVRGDFGDYGKNPMVIFEPCDPPPSWWEPLRTPEASVRSMIEAGRSIDPLTPEEETEYFPDPIVARGLERTLDDTRQEKRQDPKFMEFQFNFEVKSYRQQIQAACGDDYIPLYNVHDEVVGKVPRLPFLNYALGRTDLSELAPSWKTICPQGLKMGGDNPYHSDAYLGAYDKDGNDLPMSYKNGYPYDGLEHQAFIHTMGRIQREFGGFSATVLSGGDHPEVFGAVGEEILVLPNLDPRYLDQVLMARAIITEEGGAACHLAQEAMVRSIPILRVPDAIKKFPKGMFMTVQPGVGRIQTMAMSTLGFGGVTTS